MTEQWSLVCGTEVSVSNLFVLILGVRKKGGGWWSSDLAGRQT
jgi:hypothetical protein